jgi:hypothetical protein
MEDGEQFDVQVAAEEGDGCQIEQQGQPEEVWQPK